MLELIGTAKAQTLPALSFLTSSISPQQFIANVLTWFLVIAGAIAVIYLVYGGILYITAAGDAEKATKGRTAVLNAVIGVVIIILAIIIVRWVQTVIGGATNG